MKSPSSNVAFATFGFWHVSPSLVRKIDIKLGMIMMTIIIIIIIIIIITRAKVYSLV